MKLQIHSGKPAHLAGCEVEKNPDKQRGWNRCNGGDLSDHHSDIVHTWFQRAVRSTRPCPRTWWLAGKSPNFLWGFASHLWWPSTPAPPIPPAHWVPHASTGPADTAPSCQVARRVSGLPRNWAGLRDLAHPGRLGRCRPPPKGSSKPVPSAGSMTSFVVRKLNPSLGGGSSFFVAKRCSLGLFLSPIGEACLRSLK